MKLPATWIIVLLIGLAILGIAGPSVYPTGTTLYNPEKAYNIFVFIIGGDGFGHLIDMNGNSVHEWKNASESLDPALTGGKPRHALAILSRVEAQGTNLVPGAVTTRVVKTSPNLIGTVRRCGRSAKKCQTA